VDELLDELANAGLLTRFEAGGMRLIQILEFEKHQHCHVKEPESILPAPGQHRAERASGGDPPMPSTSPAPVLHGASTVPAPVLHRSRPAEAEAEAEGERVVVDAARARGSPRAVPLDAPTEAHEQLAREVGVSCQAEFEKFRDWLASTGTRPRDYSARFRNWLRKAGEFRARDAPRVTANDKRTATAAAMYAHRNAPTHDDQPRDITGHAERLA